MNKVLQATYHDGSLVLDEKLDAALEGKKLTLILLEDSASSNQNEADLEERKQRFFEWAKQYSAKLPPDYKQAQPTQAEILQRIEQRRTFSPAQHDLPDTLTLLQEDRAR